MWTCKVWTKLNPGVYKEIGTEDIFSGNIKKGSPNWTYVWVDRQSDYWHSLGKMEILMNWNLPQMEISIHFYWRKIMDIQHYIYSYPHDGSQEAHIKCDIGASYTSICCSHCCNKRQKIELGELNYDFQLGSVGLRRNPW